MSLREITIDGPGAAGPVDRLDPGRPAYSARVRRLHQAMTLEDALGRYAALLGEIATRVAKEISDP